MRYTYLVTYVVHGGILGNRTYEGAKIVNYEQIRSIEERLSEQAGKPCVLTNAPVILHIEPGKDQMVCMACNYAGAGPVTILYCPRCGDQCFESINTNPELFACEHCGFSNEMAEFGIEECPACGSEMMVKG